MFEHLLDPKFDSPDAMAAMDIVGAQARTLDWLDELEAADKDRPASPGARSLAQQAFAGVTNPNANPEQQRGHVMALRAPEAVRHLVGMLGAYDWDFIEQAKELRGYAVAKILEETKNTDPRIRLRALELMGKVTEIALFSERVEITHKNENTDAIEERVRARLKSLLPPVQHIEDAEIKEIAVVPQVQKQAE
jgi:hypothetical protein